MTALLYDEDQCNVSCDAILSQSETALAGGLPDSTVVAPPTVTARGSPAAENAPEQVCFRNL